MKNYAPPGGLEPPTFRLTAERASRLRHGGFFLEEMDGMYKLYQGKVFWRLYTMGEISIP